MSTIAEKAAAWQFLASNRVSPGLHVAMTAACERQLTEMGKHTGLPAPCAIRQILRKTGSRAYALSSPLPLHWLRGGARSRMHNKISAVLPVDATHLYSHCGALHEEPGVVRSVRSRCPGLRISYNARR